MKLLLWKSFSCTLAVGVGLLMDPSVQAQDPELFLQSYPNAQITVDGDAGDWNLSQFGTVVVGGMNPDFSFGDELDWVRETGTGDIAYVGFDDEVDTTVYYGGRWTGASFPENPLDHSAKIYARDNATHQYFLVDITDDEINTVNSETDHHLPDHTHPNGAAWANDSVEFYISPEGNIDPVNWESDVQLVIDAGNQVQVWNSSSTYMAQVEAGVTSVVTITETGWMLEVGIDKSVFASPLPAELGPAGPAGSNYGIDFSFRDNDDPDGTGNVGGDTAFTTAWDWADPTSSGGFPSKTPSLWGQMILGIPPTPPGDFDDDSDVDGNDFLVWQTGGSPTPLSAEDLATWETNFPTSSSSATIVSSVPEPNTLILTLVSVFVYYGYGRRQQCGL